VEVEKMNIQKIMKFLSKSKFTLIGFVLGFLLVETIKLPILILPIIFMVVLTIIEFYEKYAGVKGNEY
jgi:hypothetical protein